MPVEEFPIDQTGANRWPYYITVGPDDHLWVTTYDNHASGGNPGGSLVQISRNDPRTQTLHSGQTPPSGTQILNDPTGRNIVWFPSSSRKEGEKYTDYARINEFDVDEYRINHKHSLLKDASVGGISMVRIKADNSPSAPSVHYILFPDFQHNCVGWIELGKGGMNLVPLPIDTDGFNTSPYRGEVTVASDQTRYTYWFTGRKRSDDPQTVNGLYAYTPTDDNPWKRIPLPDPSQVPGHIIAGPATNGGETRNYLWIGASSPNQILRYDIEDGSWETSETLTGSPQQLAFGPDGLIWVVGTNKLYRFKKNNHITLLPSPDVPDATFLQGLCIDDRKVVWYTNLNAKKIGKYRMEDAGTVVPAGSPASRQCGAW
ncbi:hypothetical protein [Streptomyces luteireticuli]|uniref:hypothetical protein n=1 Tax=Streptomyces luteireticuli TaxID=173858 RepID=UPI003557384A